MKMNYCLELNAFGLSQTFVLGIRNQLILWDFSPVSESLESGPGPGPEESGSISLLSLLLHSRRHPLSPRGLHRQDLLPHAPSLPGTNLSPGPTKPSNIWDHIMLDYPSMHPFIHLINIGMYQLLYLSLTHQVLLSKRYTQCLCILKV